MLTGREYFVDGVLSFPPLDPGEENFTKRDGSYHTQFGPCVAHSGVVYGNNNANISQAFARLTKSRQPLIKGYEQWMQQKQREYIRNNLDFIEIVRDLLKYGLDDYTTMIDECIEHYADPHEKKDERICAFNDIMDQNLIEHHLWYADRKFTEYKFKKMEIAKPDNKPGRMTGNLQCPASLQGFRLTNYLKYALAADDIDFLGGDIHFCPAPSAVGLEEVFKNLLSPPRRFYFVYFSDDSCLSYRTKSGNVLRCNLDISSCDASHTGELFDLLVSITPDRAKNDMQRLVDQCKTPITIFDVNNRSRRVTLKPKHARLYSGSTLTTFINNLANILIASTIAKAEVETYEDIIQAASTCGYVVTCQPCDDFHKLQFLKHSPVLDINGRLRALLNPGVLFRLIGTCKGDLPGRSTEPFRDRAERFQAGLLQGAYPRVRAPLIDTLKKSVSKAVPCAKTTKRIKDDLKWKVDSEAEEFSITAHEMWARYDLNELEVVELENDLANCQFGDHYQSSATDKVLQADYGLQGVDYPNTEWIPQFPS